MKIQLTGQVQTARAISGTSMTVTYSGQAAVEFKNPYWRGESSIVLKKGKVSNKVTEAPGNIVLRDISNDPTRIYWTYGIVATKLYKPAFHKFKLDWKLKTAFGPRLCTIDPIQSSEIILNELKLTERCPICRG